ncbi:UNVERIFIED_CONTAM: Aldehyde oxidase GLOX [Sesamum calycinum]|uniref:Aldehyde oxidase GLOX n=1 Tax=Sesamum calycinum TaxID=2727403 RepID=A0AAW2QN13_9LAMI
MAPSLFLSFILRHLLLVLLLLLLPHRNVLTRAAGGRWDFLLSNIGISAMHMQLLYTDRVVIFDRTDFGVSNISLPAGKCRNDPSDTALVNDCTAHSVEYDVATNSVRPLMVLTDTWCSSGAVMPDGTLVQTGGYNDGDHTVRLYKPCTNNSCDWREINPGLTQRRWYATNHILPDGRAIVVGGRRQHNYEFYPKTSRLIPRTVVRTYPYRVGDPRSYPSTGSAVLLPMTENSAGSAEVLVCGGAPKGAYLSAMNGRFVTALDTCAKIRINDPNPEWVMETMPMPRVMGDMVLLPNANVLIINGAGSGAAGWELGRKPVLAPVVYRPTNPLGSRFEVTKFQVPECYHSTALLLRDGSSSCWRQQSSYPL